jgi:hypothetical protein
LASAGTDMRHGAEVEIEVADIKAVGTDIRLLANYDVVVRRAARALSVGATALLCRSSLAAAVSGAT